MIVETEPDPDLVLLERWRAGDRSAAQALARRHYAALRRFITGKVGDDVAAEVTQRVFLALCEKIDGVAAPTAFRPYLFGVARWKLVEYFRGERMRGRHFDPLEHSVGDADPRADLSAELVRDVHQQVVLQALRSLPMDDQIMLELKSYEGMTQREIGEVFGLGVAQIGGRINRARERLERAVARLSEDPELRTATSHQLESWIANVQQALVDRAGA